MTHVEGRRVYLSGPMTGIKDWNKAAFDEAEIRLFKLWANIVWNPAEDAKGFVRLNFSHENCMRHELKVLCNEVTPFDLLVSLPGWEQSAGARLEREVAVACGIEVCDLDEVVA